MPKKMKNIGQIKNIKKKGSPCPYGIQVGRIGASAVNHGVQAALTKRRKKMKPKTLRKASVEAAISVAICYKRMGLPVSQKVWDVINNNKLGGKKHDRNSREI